MTTRPCPEHPDRTSPQSTPRPHRYEVATVHYLIGGPREVLRCVWCGHIPEPRFGGTNLGGLRGDFEVGGF